MRTKFYYSMPPKKSLNKSESTTDVPDVSKPKSKKTTNTKKVDTTENVEKPEKPEKTDKPKKTTKTVALEQPEVEVVKKSRTKKIAAPEVEEVQKPKPKKTATKDQPEDKKIVTTENIVVEDTGDLLKMDSTEYNQLKIRWGTLCAQIKKANEEIETLNNEKDDLLNKLWKLGQRNYPSVDIFETPKNKTNIKASSIQTKILDNDSSDSDDSNNSDDSDSESEKQRKKIITNKKSKSDSDTSDSDASDSDSD